MLDGHHVWSNSKPGVDTVGNYVEDHHAKNRECFICIQLDHRKLGEIMYLPYLRKDPLISETCLPEESRGRDKTNKTLQDKQKQTKLQNKQWKASKQTKGNKTNSDKASKQTVENNTTNKRLKNIQ